MPTIVVGCPVYDRAWILPRWKEHLDLAIPKGFDVELAFVCNGNDEETMNIVEAWDAKVFYYSESDRSDASQRVWNESRYKHMCKLRNLLLDGVRVMAPDYFLSLDSDILLDDRAITSALDALDTVQDAWACGMRLYMTPTSEAYTSAIRWGRDRHFRATGQRVQKVDVIMAAKLMLPLAYHIDYEVHKMGEDAGWSNAVTNEGGVLIWDGRISNKHVMSKSDLDKYDSRVGF